VTQSPTSGPVVTSPVSSGTALGKLMKINCLDYFNNLIKYLKKYHE